MNSIQSSRYIERRMGEQLNKEILVRNGILSAEESKEKPVVINCPRCALINQHENKYCSKCSYQLTPQAYDEIKESENIKYLELEKRYEKDLKTLREDMEKNFK